MPGRRSFNTDGTFLEKLAIGAIGARAVFKELQRQGHPPVELERGWDKGLLGSNTTGSAAEKLGWRWSAFKRHRTCLAASALRLMDELPAEELATLWSRLHLDELLVEVNRQQRELVLMKKPAPYLTDTKRR